MAVKLFGQNVPRSARLATHCVFRMSSTGDPCTSKGDGCKEPPAAKEPCPPKTECSAPPPPPPPIAGCREPQPCPPLPVCPPAMCPFVPSPKNPCNYCPPVCANPNAPDLTRLKKLQCKFQENNGIPIYLKGGKFDVFLFQLTVVITVVGNIAALYYCVTIL